MSNVKKKRARAIKAFSIKPIRAQLNAWERAAKRCGISRHAWARAVMDVASGRSEAVEQLQRVEPAEDRQARRETEEERPVAHWVVRLAKDRFVAGVANGEPIVCAGDGPLLVFQVAKLAQRTAGLLDGAEVVPVRVEIFSTPTAKDGHEST